MKYRQLAANEGWSFWNGVPQDREKREHGYEQPLEMMCIPWGPKMGYWIRYNTKYFKKEHSPMGFYPVMGGKNFKYAPREIRGYCLTGEHRGKYDDAGKMMLNQRRTLEIVPRWALKFIRKMIPGSLGWKRTRPSITTQWQRALICNWMGQEGVAWFQAQHPDQQQKFLNIVQYAYDTGRENRLKKFMTLPWRQAVRVMFKGWGNVFINDLTRRNYILSKFDHHRLWPYRSIRNLVVAGHQDVPWLPTGPGWQQVSREVKTHWLTEIVNQPADHQRFELVALVIDTWRRLRNDEVAEFSLVRTREQLRNYHQRQIEAAMVRDDAAMTDFPQAEGPYFRWVPEIDGITFLGSRSEIDAEAQEMHHCVYGYHSQIINNTSFIYKVEKEGLMRSTVEVRPGYEIAYIGQHFSYCNKPVDEVTRSYVENWINEFNKTRM